MADAPRSGDLLPVRMVNEYAYCPRLFHLMHVEGRWADNAFTEEGKEVHRRVDRIDRVLPDPDPDRPDGAQHQEGEEPPTISRSVTLGSETLGIVSKLDLVSTAGDEAVPVETKRGRVPDTPQRSWEPERVQLMAQGLLLREAGYRCDHGVLYFAGSRTRVDVPFTAELEARTLRFIREARSAARRTTLPDPLEDSPKCNGCSLSGICLPDETLALRAVPPTEAQEGWASVRRLYPGRGHAVPLYVQEQGARVGKRRTVVVVRKGEEELGRARLKDLSQLVLCGNVSVSAQAIHLLCEANVPIVHLSRGHWFYGVTTGISLRNAYDRAAQFRAAADPSLALRFARAVVSAKGANQRRLLVRNARPDAEPETTEMATLLRKVEHAPDAASLLGLEGGIAAKYFARFGDLLRPKDFDADWDFGTRNRRPPRDPVNALLSFGYALLAKECSTALLGEGLDPWWGLFHQPRHGRPSLALDLMEELRAPVADRVVLTLINRQQVAPSDFAVGPGGAVRMNERARKALIVTYQKRKQDTLVHPFLKEESTVGLLPHVQARLLARHLRGDLDGYPPFFAK